MEIRTEGLTGSADAPRVDVFHDPTRLGPPLRTRRHAARRVRFALWTMLLVGLICVSGALARPARTPGSHATSARAFFTSVAPANAGAVALPIGSGPVWLVMCPSA